VKYVKVGLFHAPHPLSFSHIYSLP
ncbi:hypothetical protein PvtlMGM2_1394, partial [Prevotella sp. MGM2]